VLLRKGRAHVGESRAVGFFFLWSRVHLRQAVARKVRFAGREKLTRLAADVRTCACGGGNKPREE
jgi:hypothetical protein